MYHLQRFHREQSPHFSVISFTTYNLFRSSCLLNGISMFHNLAASSISIVAIHFWPRSLLKAVESYRIVLHCGVMSSLYSFQTRIILPISPNGSSKIDWTSEISRKDLYFRAPYRSKETRSLSVWDRFLDVVKSVKSGEIYTSILTPCLSKNSTNASSTTSLCARKLLLDCTV